MKRLLFALLAIGFAVSAGVVLRRAVLADDSAGYVRQSDGAAAAAGGGFHKALEKGALTLYADFSTGEFYIEDSRSGRTWFSNPEGRENDWGSGFNLQLLNSRLLIDANVYTEPEAPPVETRYADFASNCTAAYKLTDDGLIMVYDFQRPQIMVPVKYSLTDTGLTAELLNGEVVEYGTSRLTNVSILPSFGAGSPEDEGYILIPDGAGALIDFNNNKSSADKLEEADVYGFNAGTGDRTAASTEQYKSKKTLSEAVNLPLWGVKLNDDGYLAVITGGAARATLYAQSGGMGSGFNMAYATYAYRDWADIRMLTKGFEQKQESFPEVYPDLANNYKIEYTFLPHGKSDYTDMAEAYRHTLGLGQPLPNTDIPFYLDVYGHIVKTKPRFGIPADTVIPTASFSKAEAAVNELTDLGVRNIQLKYNYWQRDGYFGKLTTDPKPLASLGGEKGLRSLKSTLEANGGSLFLTYEPLNAYKTGGGFWVLSDALRTIARTPQKQYAFSLANSSADSRYDPWYLVRPQRIEKFFDKYWGNFSEAGYGYPALDSIGDTLYSELASDGIKRDEVAKLFASQLEKTGGVPLMLNGGNAYAAVYADHIVDAPARSSGLDIYDREVPFWQIVFHGRVNYALNAANLSSNPGEMKLKALETGASPMFSWVFENEDELIGSRSDYLFSAGYARWAEQAARDYAEINAVLSKVSGETVTAHKREGSISVTEYGGRLTVVCNYGGEEAEYGGGIIPAKGYVVIE
ncbi:MAG: DUF5696 domain-containing protein [Clostridiales bacterium]|nr:DUF5696 domain-containing protein [Clostridiales bacterium]